MRAIEQNLFQHYALQEPALVPFGFVKENDVYVYHSVLKDSGFAVKIQVLSSGEIDGTLYEDDLEFEGHRHEILGTFSAAIKEEYISLLLSIRDACYVSVRPRSYYLLPSNPAVYDVARGFDENEGFLNWPARKKMREGDLVFIYSARPFKGILFCCEVVAVDEAQEGYGGHAVFMTMLKRVRAYQEGEVPLNELMEHGLKTVRFLHKMSPEVAEFILSK